MQDFKKLKAWQLADDLAVAIYKVTKAEFPPTERFGLTSQVRRAAVSAASNIAEGSKRKSKKDFLRFLFLARGSLGEVEYCLHLARRLGFLSERSHGDLTQLCEEASRTLYGLIQAVGGEIDAGLE